MKDLSRNLLKHGKMVDNVHWRSSSVIQDHVLKTECRLRLGAGDALGPLHSLRHAFSKTVNIVRF